MRRKYVLDESVIKGGIEGRSCCKLAVSAIVRRCDCLVYNDEWQKKCYSEIARHAHSVDGLYLLRIMKYAFSSTRKMIQETQTPPPLKDESEIHAKDLWIVRLAAAAEACIVTMDRPLLCILRSRGVACLGPNEAIEG